MGLHRSLMLLTILASGVALSSGSAAHADMPHLTDQGVEHHYWQQSHPFADSADECPTIDLRPYFGPARDQGNIGWCYANATADLLSFYYYPDLKGKRVSSTYTALVYNDDSGADPFDEGGIVEQTIAEVANSGLCPESIENEVLNAYPADPLKKKLSVLSELKAAHDGATKTQEANRAYTRILAYLQRIHEQQDPRHPKDLLRIGIVRLLEILDQSTPKDFPLKIAQELCKDAQMPVSGRAPTMTRFSKEGSFTDWMYSWKIRNRKVSPVIHQELEHFRPVAIDYDAGFLNDPKSKFTDWNFAVDFFHPVDLMHRHASLIVGQRWDPEAKVCRFMLRNSWGTGCGYPNPLFNPKKGGHCEDGVPFVVDRQLETQISSIQTFGLLHRPTWHPVLETVYQPAPQAMPKK